MRLYARKGSASYSRRLIKALELKPVGDWTQNLQNTSTWRLLRTSHLKRRLEALKKAKTRKEVNRILKTPTPEQRLITLCETASLRPLTSKEAKEYLSLFRELFPKAYQKLFGKTPPWKLVEPR